MRNFFLTLIAFPFFSLLTACGALIGLEDNDKSCDLGNGDQTQVWGQVEYLLPECWKVTSTYPDLVLVGLGETIVKIGNQPFEEEEGVVSSMSTVELSAGGTLYVSILYVGDMITVIDLEKLHEKDIQNILDSLTWKVTEGVDSKVTWNGVQLPTLEGLYWCGSETVLLLSYENPANYGLEYPDCASDSPNYMGSDIPLSASFTKNVHTDLSLYLGKYKEIDGYTIGAIEEQTLGEASYQKAHLTYTGDFGPGVGGLSVYLFKKGEDVFLFTLDDFESKHESELLNTFLQP